MHEKRVVVGTKSVVLGFCLSALKVHEWPNKRGLGQLFANLHHHLKKRVLLHAKKSQECLSRWRSETLAWGSQGVLNGSHPPGTSIHIRKDNIVPRRSKPPNDLPLQRTMFPCVVIANYNSLQTPEFLLLKFATGRDLAVDLLA